MPKPPPQPAPGWGDSDTAAPAADHRAPASPSGRRGGHEFTDAKRGERLQKVIAAAGVASRRAAEEMIEAGDVKVNGHLVDSLPAWVDVANDVITIKGKRINRPERPVYVMLFKPRGVLCTNDDPEGRKRAIDLVEHPSKARLYPVGRLDADSSGLLLMTNDGELAARLTHPRYGVHKTYQVTIEGSLEDKHIQKLERGLFLNESRTSKGAKPGRKTNPSSLTIIKRDRDRTKLRLRLGEGRNRQIRRMMARLGHPVKKLRRVRMGPVKLQGLKPGQWRDLEPLEVKSLRKAAGLG